MRNFKPLRAILGSLLAGLLAVAPLAASNVTGTITTATGSPVSNGTLTFTLNQAGIQPGVFNVVSSPISCYTSTNGAVVGVPNPVVAPAVTGSTASGS